MVGSNPGKAEKKNFWELEVLRGYCIKIRSKNLESQREGRGRRRIRINRKGLGVKRTEGKGMEPRLYF